MKPRHRQLQTGGVVNRPKQTTRRQQTRHKETRTDDATKRRDDNIIIIEAESRSSNNLERQQGGPFERLMRRDVQSNDLERRQQGELFVRSMQRAVQSRSDLERREEPFERSMRSCERGMIDNRVFNNTNKTLEERRSNSYPSCTIVKAINQDQQVWRSSTGMQTV